MKLFKLIFFIVLTIGCNKKRLTSDNDVNLLKSYINLPIEAVEVEYQIFEENLRVGSQDCNKLIRVVGILRFSNDNFQKLRKIIEEESSYDIMLSSGDEFYQPWYDDKIKKLFNMNNSNNIVTTVYSGNFLKKNKSDNASVFITDDNRMIIKIGRCE